MVWRSGQGARDGLALLHVYIADLFCNGNKSIVFGII